MQILKRPYSSSSESSKSFWIFSWISKKFEVEQSIDEVEELLQLVPTYDSEEEREKTEREEQQVKEEMLKESEQEMQLAQQMTNFSKSPFPGISGFEAQFYEQIKPRMRKVTITKRNGNIVG